MNYFFKATYITMVLLLFTSIALAEESIIPKPIFDDDLSILGIKLGDSPEEVKSNLIDLKLTNPKNEPAETRVYTAEDPVTGNTYIAKFEIMDQAKLPESSEKDNFLTVDFSTPNAGNKVIGIRRNMDNSHKSLLCSKIKEALVDRYGQPTMEKSSPKYNSIEYFWKYDQSGTQLPDKKIQDDSCTYEHLVLEYPNNCNGTYFHVRLSGVENDYFNTADIALFSFDYANSGWKIEVNARKIAKEKQDKENLAKASNTKIKM